ncbi:MAG TPA: PQQ-dependent sugar dehydrogenase [Clostridia bacterium]|nr:PQQ-dependent sugar dehydrogenase [Clostridia bacterium]
MILKFAVKASVRFGCVLALLGVLPACAQQREVSRLFAEHCAGCHGANLEGGQTESMLDDQWKHGGDDASLARIIRDGFEQEGMPAFKGLFSEAEIRAMVVFIHEKRTQARTRGANYPKPTLNEVVKTREHSFRLTTVAERLDTPWALAFLPDGRMLVTELPGGLRYIDKGQVSEPVSGTPRVRAQGQGGMMEVALHPGYSSNGWVYLAYSDPGSTAGNRDAGMTAVVRGRIREGKWVEEQTIFRAPPWSYRGGGIHFGCRIVFDESGHIFFPIGERGQMWDAQDLTRPNGKVHRLFDDGRIPPDNPFVGQSNALASIWSYGHRNPQGLDRHPVTGELWDTEHGPRGGDELNLVIKARNYGWPIITHGMNYNGTPMTEFTAKPGLEQPVLHWTPSIAVCGIDFYDGTKFPRWRNNLLVTGLASEELRRVVIEGHQVSGQEILFKGIGRVRDVASGPDGFIYVVLNKPDKIVRLEPAER